MAELVRGTRVRLRNPYDAVYKKAWVDSEGWVGEFQVDDDGFERIFVIWDKDHPRYDGENDMWTFANHFEVIGPPPARLTQEIVAEAQSRRDAEVFYCEHCNEYHELDAQVSETDKYLELLQQAADIAARGRGFLLVTLETTEDGKTQPYVFSMALDEEAGDLIEMQTTVLAQSGHLSRLREAIMERKSESGRKASDD